MGIDENHTGQAFRVAPHALLLVAVVVLPIDLNEHGLVDFVAIHFEEQRFDRLVPVQRRVAMTVDEAHSRRW